MSLESARASREPRERKSIAGASRAQEHRRSLESARASQEPVARRARRPWKLHPGKGGDERRRVREYEKLTRE
eukprot:361405-Chlamydomonas_euryale.AAC.4